MPPRYLRKGTTKLKACSEFTVEACDLAPADQCCGALPCTLCLELETYADGISYGTATFGGSTWTGTVGGHDFVSYWERNYLTDECEYVVTLDAEEVYRATCYEGASCRNPGGSVDVTIGYDEGTLTWAKHEPRPLALTVDPDTGCNDFFCGTCRCSCDCLCVTITEVGIVTGQGEICATPYPCDAPVWEGTVGYYDLSIALGRDHYTGECIITLTANGDEQEPVFVTGCADMSASVTLYDGTTIEVRCKQCSCDELWTCGTGCCLPADFTQPLYPNGVLTAIPFCVTSPSSCNADLCGTFEPIDPTNSNRGPCGFCATYRGTWAGSLPGLMPSGLPDVATGYCMYTPCSIQVCFALECMDDEQATLGVNACCGKLRLWIGTSTLQDGDIGESPQIAVADCVSWKKVSPTMCECDGVGGALASFPVSITLPCDEVWVGTVCDGLTKCCQIKCADFEVVI